MDQSEQLMLQVWLGGLKAKLLDGDVNSVVKELDIALTRIEEEGNERQDERRRRIDPRADEDQEDRGSSESPGGQDGDKPEAL